MRRKVTKASAGILAAALVMSALPCGSMQAQAAAKPSLSAESATVSVGNRLTLKVKNKAAGTTAKWKTSKKRWRPSRRRALCAA